MTSKLILVTGGIKSGKSRFAEEKARDLGNDVLYIATAQAYDREMQDKIAIHKDRRPESWFTVEEPYDVSSALARYAKEYSVILIDCIGMLLNNLVFHLGGSNCEEINEEVRYHIFDKIKAMLATAKEANKQVIIVSNETGFSLVSENRLGRHYQEVLGQVNQMIAAYANEVYLVIAGCAVQIKGGTSECIKPLV